MRAYVAKCILGVFAYDEKGRLLDSEDFPRDADKVARALVSSGEGLLEEEKKLVGRLEGYEAVLEKESPVKGFAVQNPNPAGEIVRRELEAIASSKGLSEDGLRTFIHEVSYALAGLKVQDAAAKKDRAVIQASGVLEDLDEALNLLSERMQEWCSLLPQSIEREQEHRKQAELICASGSMTGGEGEALKSYAGQVLALYALRDGLEEYTASAMDEVAPNLKAVLGSSLGAKLISVGGGLDNLARIPASRIQVLGAEKAMFRHLRKRAPPPKHGIIYQHALIQRSPWWQRGKVSRALAGKVAIACRTDAHSGPFVGDELKGRFLKRVEEIRAAYPKAPGKRKR